MIAEFSQLERLILSNNGFKWLPNNMELLVELSEIVLTGIDFDDMEHTRMVLSSMPGLMSVDINLAVEEDADLLLRDLP
jgi:hypothetical protein